ncbi:MAG: hypothetical protein ACR2NL_05675, partial [Acidimicrobiia bacterium]
ARVRLGSFHMVAVTLTQRLEVGDENLHLPVSRFSNGDLMSQSNSPTGDPGAEQFMTVDAFDVAVGAGESDTAVVAKDHSGPLPDQGRTRAEHESAMEREKDWLRRAGGISGIVQLVEDPDKIVTQFAGSRTLRSDCPEPRASARALAHVAETIGELCARGLVHGSVTPEHVILTTDGAAVLCSPNTSDDPADDLVGLGLCLEFATEQWGAPPDSITRWLLLAKQLRDRDPTVGPERAARILMDFTSPDVRDRPVPLRLLMMGVLGALGLVVAAVSLLPEPTPSVSGPEVEVDGHVVRVGLQGQVGLAKPADRCRPATVYLLDPGTFQIWTFDRFETGRSGIPLVRVPGATGLRLSEALDGCMTVIARGPAGEVPLP